MRQDVLNLISESTILIGHSLENDLRALYIYHSQIIDTSILYSLSNNRKVSLKALCMRYF